MQRAPRLVLACAAALCAAPSLARAADPKLPEISEGRLGTREGKEFVDVPLRHTEVSIRVAGHLADVEVVQTFQNPYARKIDATYLFPLPTSAAVNEMEIVSGGRTLKGEIKKKDEARRVFQEARQKGHVAALLTQERPNLFTQAVANLEPGAEVAVTIRYVQALDYEAGAYELVFPMVAGPRYLPRRSKELTAEAAAALQPPVLPPGRRSAHDIGLSVDIDGGVPLAGLSSPSHLLTIVNPSPTRAKVWLAPGDTVPNKDFTLRVQVAGRQPGFAVLPYRDGAGPGSFYLMAQPPAAADDAQVTPRELVFVIDTSSSMAGKPLAKAKEVVRRGLAGLGPDHTFQIVRFDEAASALGPRPIANKPRNVALALGWLDALEAAGGTEMVAGVSAALDFPHDPARLRLVVFLTDGYIGNEDEILATVGDKLGPSRLFSFGVGSAVNRYLLEEMARIGRGAVQVVRPDEDTAKAVAKFEQRIARPVLTDITVDWKGLAVADVVPGAIPDLFLGQPLVLAGHYTRGGAATITVKARQAGRSVAFDVPVALPDRDVTRPAVASVWARARIAELSRQELRGARPEVTKEIVDLALAHGLMTRYTAFVVVDASRVTQGGPAEPVAVPVEVPDGVRRDVAYNTSGAGAAIGIGGSGEGGGGVGYGYGVAGGSVGVITAKAAKPTEVVVLDEDRADPDPAREPEAAPPPKPAPANDGRARKAAVRVAAGDDGGLAAASKAQGRQCYEQQLKANPELRGELALELEVGDDGAVTGARVVSSPDAAVGACVAAAARKWKLKKAAARRAVTFALELE